MGHGDRFRYGPFEVKVAYLCHPFSGYQEGNTLRAVNVARAVNLQLGPEWYVFVPHCQGVVCNFIPEDVAMGFCQRMVVMADMVVIGSQEITAGMSEEINLALRIGKVVKEWLGGELVPTKILRRA